MSYTINPNAKNKWARNAENTMDLSLETDASSVYLDNGRTLEQELGEGSMVSNVATIDSAMSKIIDGTLDGAYESGVMYGRSLVNLVSNHKIKIANGTTNSFPMVIPMDAKKKYLISFKIDTAHTSTGEPNQSAIKLQYYSHNNNKGYNFIYNSELADGREFKFIVEPFSGEVSQDTNFFAIWLTRYESGTLHGKLSVFEYVDGMENWDIPYFDGLCDVKMPILRNVGKNLFDGQIELGSINVDTGQDVTSTKEIRSKNFTPITGRPFILSRTDKTGSLAMRYYDANKNYLGTGDGGLSEGGASRVCNPPHNARYVRFKDITSDLSQKIQIEYSDSQTPYEDHKTNILHTPETVTLRSLPNGVRDELNLNTGEYIKRIGEAVLDGSEDWSVNNSNNEGFYSASTTTYVGKPKGAIISDKLPTITTTKAEGVMMGVSTGKVMVSFNRDSTGVSNINSFVEKLAQNPITVQYELATPITTTIEPLSIPFTYENGHIVLESGFEGQSLLPTLEYSTVINRTGQIQSITNTIQKQEKQLTMLEKMLIQNIINLDYNNTLLTLKNEMEEML